MFEFLAAARFAHFAAICILFGLAAFPFYAVGPGEDAPRFDRAIRWSAVLALLTAWIVLLAMTANIGGSAASAFDPGVLSAVAGDTQFGRVWMGRIVLAVVLLAFCVKRRVRPGRDKALLILSGLLLASVALTGHSALPGGVPGILHTIADVAHLIAAGWWVGGLLALVLVARTLGDRALPLLERFSGTGYGAVAAIVLTGLFKSALLLASISSSIATAYGWVLLVKIGLAAAMGLLALSNRFWITPALKRGGEQTLWLGRLHWQVSVEFALGLLVLAVAGILGAMSPPISS
jgi:putative copper resistance protein D